MTSSTPSLVCVGHIVHEVIRFPDRSEGPYLGGPPAYCSVAAARQGVAAALVTRIGEDMPEELLRPFAEAGVDTRGLARSGATTRTELVYRSAGAKEILYGARADAVRAADVPTAYRGCDVVYVCTMDNDVPLDELGAVAGMGRISAIDLGGYGGVHVSPDRRAALRDLSFLALSAAAPFAVAKASDEDVAAIFGPVGEEKAAEMLLDAGCTVVVISAGARGCFVSTRTGRWHVPPMTGRPVDATGGGDTFMAGFLASYRETGDPLAAARWGSATAAIVIERRGGVSVQRMPSRREVEERLAPQEGRDRSPRQQRKEKS